MLRIIYGNEPFLIEQKLKEIIKNCPDYFINKFDGQDNNLKIQRILDAIGDVGLFAQKTLVLVKDPFFLIKKYDEKDIYSLIEYCNNPIYENELVFYTLENKFNSRLKVFKDIAKNAEVNEINKLDRYKFYDFASREINSKALNISKDAKDYLINNSNNDISLLERNIDVLSLYPDTIDFEAIRKLISLPQDDDVFGFINALTSKKVELAIKQANKLLENDGSVLALIASVASQLRFLYSVAYYRSIGYKLNDIIRETKAKEFRIKKAYETLEIMSEIDILKLLSKLFELDYKCKTNADIKDKLNLELLIVSMME